MAWSSKGGKPCQLTPTGRYAAAAAGAPAGRAAHVHPLSVPPVSQQYSDLGPLFLSGARQYAGSPLPIVTIGLEL